ncbi:hypothetical protein [Rhizobium sp. 18055]|uniref:hypothetical protein n=1 Tax=Rhizobium sp. 18055 TaxID=2681403 RepID=UPI00190F82DE|nr:hypothetical protein [Rhizobium sp. 18055]
MIESPASAGLFFSRPSIADPHAFFAAWWDWPVDKITRNLNAIGSMDLDALEKTNDQ